MSIVVSGIGIVSALGIGLKENLKTIRRMKGGISPTPSILETDIELPVGEILLTDGQLHDIAGIRRDRHLSRTALLGIIAVKEALTDAGIGTTRKIGLVSSTSVGGMDRTELFYRQFTKEETSGRLRHVIMHDCAASTAAITEHCGINSYSTTISTACSSAANAVIAGARLLRHGIVDCVAVGGCDALTAFTLNGFNSLMILDKVPCRPFDNRHAGLNLGEGAGFLILQLKESVSSYYCELAGYANRNDAYHQTATSDNGTGAYLAMAKALEMAGILPDDIEYINAHGTGTVNNDNSESRAMLKIFGNSLPPFSSTKSLTGHTLAAAGGIEAALTAVAVKEGYLYPNLNFETPVPEFNISPIHEFRSGYKIKYAMSNSFGFGGNCTSLIFSR